MSGLSSIVTVGLPILLHEAFSVAEEAAVAIALVTAFVVNFVTLRVFVFGSIGNKGHEIFRFGLVSAGFRLAEYGIFLVAHNVLQYYYVFALAVMLAISAAGKFVVYKYFVFFRKAGTPANVG